MESKLKSILSQTFTVLLLTLLLYPSVSRARAKNKKVVIAYVTSWSKVMPDPTYLTHINYAFAHVSDSFDGLRIDNESRLKAITDLKKAHPHLKVLLSVGGWGIGRSLPKTACVWCGSLILMVLTSTGNIQRILLPGFRLL
jgi:chitinase